MKKMNNKGFSLVELIVVIAIMAVLVGVLAPQFIKYVENSRRATDVSTAENIRESILADIADQRAPFDGDQLSPVAVDSSHLPSAISEAPTPKATDYKLQSFKAAWNAGDGTCDVYVDSYILTDPAGAAAYKNQQPVPTGSQKATVS